MTAEPSPLRELDASLDPELDKVVFKAIQKLPERRYQDLHALSEDLSRIRHRVAAKQGDSTVHVAHPDPATLKRSSAERTPTPRQILNLDAIGRRRATQIETHLTDALHHLRHRRLEQAVEQCELALVLDPTNGEALKLLQETHHAIDDRQLQLWLTEAESHLSNSAFSEASFLIDKALQLDPDSSAAIRLQRMVKERRLEREQARERARAAGVAVDRAQRSLTEGTLEAALRSVNEALAQDPEHHEARALKDRVYDQLAERRRRLQEHQERAIAVVASARKLVMEGDRRGGLALLRAFNPPHPEVDEAAAALAKEIATIEEAARSKAREEQERRREADRIAREMENARRQQKTTRSIQTACRSTGSRAANR